MEKKFTIALFALASCINAWSMSFIHTVTNTSLSSGQSYVNHPSLNDKGAVRPIVTQLYSGPYNDHKVSIYHEVNGAEIKWFIYNVDLTPLPIGSSYVIQVPDASEIAFTYDYNGATTTFVNIDHTGLNTYLNSPVFLTENMSNNVNNIAITNNTTTFRVIGVNGTSIPASSTFHVFMHRGVNCFIYKSITPIGVNWTPIDHPALNNNPDALITITQNGSMGSTTFNKNVGLWYNTNTQQWTIFTQDQSTFPAGVAFNIYFEKGKNFEDYDALVHVTNSVNINTFVSTIDHVKLNNNPNAKPIINLMYNSNANVTYKNMGIYYQASLGKWQLYSIDKSNLFVNLVYNILVPKNTSLATMDSVTSAKKFGIAYNFSDAVPIMKNNPHGPLLFTQSWRGSEYDTSRAGFTYLAGSWLLRNAAGTDIPLTTRYHFLPVYGSNCVVLNNATGYTIDHPESNNNPNAALFVAPVYNGLGQSSAQYHSFPFFPVYSTSLKKWTINMQGAPANMVLNVFIAKYTTISSVDSGTDVGKSLSIYPNPATNHIFVNEAFERAELMDVHGSKMTVFDGNTQKIELKGYEKGLYVLKLYKGLEVSTHKLVVE